MTNLTAAITITLATNWITTDIITPVIDQREMSRPSPILPFIPPPKRWRQRAEVIESHIATLEYHGRTFRWLVEQKEVTNSIPPREVIAIDTNPPKP